MVPSTVDRPEVFIALIAPIGVNLNYVQEELCNALEHVSYNPQVVKLTSFLDQHPDWFDLNYDSEFERYQKYIKAGNELCKISGRRDAMVIAGIAQIYKFNPKRPDEISNSTAYIFRQIKRTEEIETLRQVYGSNIVFLGCYAPRKARVKTLTSLLLRNQRGVDSNKLEADALKIIGIDENEKDVLDGQRFLDAYPHSDFIVDCSDANSIRSSLSRFIECFFGYQFASPTRDEHGMYLAQSASLRSTDLSRQVGAAIFGEQREIISLGCNEVPAYGGGTYWANNNSDARDFQIGYDSNAKIRQDMIRDLLVRLKNAHWLSSEKSKKTANQLSMDALVDIPTNQGPLARAMISDVIEYGRMVHAEMNAISDAARFGRATRGGILYCTTMPCHLCTKLIVASGLVEVQYLQPYYKSLVRELYEDSVAIDESETFTRVKFQPFRGVTPNGYRLVFEKGKRKDSEDRAVKWVASTALPIFTTDYPSYLNTEANVVKLVAELIASMQGAKNPMAM